MKEENFNKLSARAKQKVKLLVARPDFQEEVLRLRKGVNIPENGFRENKSSQKWYYDLCHSDDDYIQKVWFKRKSEIIKLEKLGKYSDAEKLKKDLTISSPLNSFRISIKNLIKKYKLPLNWEESIRRYIIFDDIDKMWIPLGLNLYTELDKDTELQRLYLEIQGDTTKKDIEKQWELVKHYQKKLNSHIKEKFQPIKKFERDKRAYELEKEGKTIDEIADIINQEFDIALDYNQLNIVLKRYKKRLNIN